MPTAHLDDRAVLAVTGRDAKAFLQGLITNDIEKAAPSLYAALLTPQGKILFEFFVTEHETGFLLDCAADRAPELVKRLTFYRLRAKVEITPAADLKAAAMWDGASPSASPSARSLPRCPC